MIRNLLVLVLTTLFFASCNKNAENYIERNSNQGLYNQEETRALMDEAADNSYPYTTEEDLSFIQDLGYDITILEDRGRYYFSSEINSVFVKSRLLSVREQGYIQPLLSSNGKLDLHSQHLHIIFYGTDSTESSALAQAIEEWNNVELCNIHLTSEYTHEATEYHEAEIEIIVDYYPFNDGDMVKATEMDIDGMPFPVVVNLGHPNYSKIQNEQKKYFYMHVVGRILRLNEVQLSADYPTGVESIMVSADHWANRENIWNGFNIEDIATLQQLYPIPNVTYSTNWTPALKLGRYLKCGEEYDLAINYSNPAYPDAELRYSINIADDYRDSYEITPKEDNKGATVMLNYGGDLILSVEEIYNDSVVGTHKHEIYAYGTPMVRISSVPILDEGKMERGEMCTLNIKPSYAPSDPLLDDPQYSYRVLKGNTDVTNDVMRVVEHEHLNRVEIEFDNNDAPGLYRFQTLIYVSDVLFDTCEFPLRLMTTPSISYSWDSSVSTNGNRYCLKKGTCHEVTVNYTNGSYEEAPDIEVSANNSAGYVTKLSDNKFRVKMNTHGEQELTVSITNEDGSEEEYSIPLYVLMDEYEITLNRSESDGIYYHFEYDWWHPEYSDVYAAVEANEFYFRRGGSSGITIQETAVENIAELKLDDHGCYTVTVSLMDSESDLAVSEKTFVIINLATIGSGATITYRSSIPEDVTKVGFCPHHQITDDCRQVYDQRFIYSIEYNNNINTSLANPSVGFYADYEYELRTAVGFAIQDRRLNREWYHDKVFVMDSAQISLLAHWYVFDDTPAGNPDAEWVQYDYYQYLTGYLFWPKNGIYKTNLSEDALSYPIQYVNLGIQNNMAPQMTTPFPYK